MGGKALSVESVRLSASRYHCFEAELLTRIRQLLPGRRIEAILAYSSKASFGDMDVLIEGGQGFDPIAVGKALGATEIVRNGDVTSIGIEVDDGVFQVDLIKIPAASFEFAVRYFAYNDMGNLLGRVAHKFGAKFGHLGLLYPLRDPSNSDHLIAEVMITTDFSTALTLLGYNATLYEERHASGQFQTLDDIFQYVVSSPYVNRDIYLLDNRNYKSRTRDAKRRTYTLFLDWLKTQQGLHAYPWGAPGSAERLTQRQSFLDVAFEAVPLFKQTYADAMEKHDQLKRVKRYFNGDMVSALTGLSGKELGVCMRRIRESFDSDYAFETFFEMATEVEAAEAILIRSKQ